MSTFLELCNHVRREAKLPSAELTDVVDQTDQREDIVEWVKQAWIEIQIQHNGRWKWLHRDFYLDTEADKQAYTYSDCTDVLDAAAITRLQEWDIHDRELPPRAYLLSSGKSSERWLTSNRYPSFQRRFVIGSQASSSPAYISQDQADRLLLGPTPNDVWRVSARYWRSPQELATASEVPEMPSQYHFMIVYKAIEKYAFGDLAQEFLARSDKEYSAMRRNLEANQLIDIHNLRMGAPMA